MKTLLFSLMLLGSVKSYSQTKNVGIVWGSSYGNVPQVIKRSDGGVEVRGDSITAIKMLLKEIERRDSSHNAQTAILFKAISDLQKAHKEYVKGVQSIFKK